MQFDFVTELLTFNIGVFMCVLFVVAPLVIVLERMLRNLRGKADKVKL